VHQSAETAWLDRGDGVCRNYDEAGKQCLIYADRPLVCRVEEYYLQHLSTQFTWGEFVKINLDICAAL